MHSHSDGEMWGYASTSNGQHVVTTADDNQILLWDTKEHRRIGKGTISQKQIHKKSGASTLSHFPPNQQARALAINQNNGHLAVSNNLGRVSIRSSLHSLDDEIGILN